MLLKRTAFTLIELLVAIGIVAILIGLLVVAVQRVRSAALRAQCVNNLNQISSGLHAYHEANNDRFPAGVEGAVPPKRFLDFPRTTWMVNLLPFVEQQSLFRQYDPNYGMSAPNTSVFLTFIDIYICPADSRGIAFDSNGVDLKGSRSNYVACFNPYGATVEPDANVVIDQGFNDPSVNPAAAPTKRKVRSAFNYNVRRGKPDIVDGLSNTILVSEVITGSDNTRDDRGQWWHDFGYLYTHHATPNSQVGDYSFAGECDAGFCDQTIAPCDCTCTYWSTKRNAARSRHRGGVNALFADGSVHFVQDSVSLDVWQALGSINGSEPIGAGDL